MVKRTPILKIAVEVGSVYLLHFDIQPNTVVPSTREDATKPFHARHYLGFATDPQARIAQHYNATSGVKLIDALHERSLTFTVAKIWDDKDRGFERRLKNQGGLSRHCPICKALGIDRDALRKKKVEVEVAPEAAETGPDFVEKTSATHTREDAKTIKTLLQGMDLRLNLSGSVSRKGVSEHDLDFHAMPGASFSYPQFHNVLKSAGFEFSGNSWNVFRNRQPEAGYDLFQYTKEEPKMKVDFFFKRNSVSEKDFLSGVKTSSRKEAAAADLANLRSYLTLNKREMGEELARSFSSYWQEFVENEHPEFADKIDEDGYTEDFDAVPENVFSDFLDEYGSRAMQDDPAMAPTFL